MNRATGWTLLPVVLAITPALMAQPSAQRIGYVYPAGGRQGSTFEVKVGGQFLDGVARLDVSGTGIQGTIVEHTKPITGQQANTLREKLQELQKLPRDPNTQKELAEIRRLLATQRPPNPAIAEVVTLQVTIAADAACGPRELRLGTPRGLTNPLAFYVGSLPEFSRPAARPRQEGNRPRQQGPGGPPQGAAASAEMAVTLPAVLNGQIMPGCADRFRFSARKGQSLVMAASARELIPYLADAVPGWFQATLALYDAKGNELAYDDHFEFHPDPVLHYVIPEDSNYVIEIKDAIYRGRDDFVYRIAVGERPFVTSVFPLGGRAGTQTAVEMKGWNLPVTGLTQDDRDKEPGIYALSVDKDGSASNKAPFAVDTLPECLEEESDAPQQVSLPIIVNGRIGSPGDWDVFRFRGHEGDPIVAEVHARRLDSPLDSVLRLTDEAGRQIAFNDDREDKGAGLSTHHADSWLSTTLPASGTYDLHVGDAQQKGGPEYGYRVRISAPRPDFELRVVPSSVNLRAGGSAILTVYALRKDGFSGEISLALKDAPIGFALAGARVPARQDQVRITLTAPSRPVQEPFSLSLEGSATIGGQDRRRPAVPAEDMMQAFAYRHLVCCQDLRVAVIEGQGFRTPVRILGPTPVKIPAGGTARVRIGAPSRGIVERFQFELNQPPEGITLAEVTAVPEGAELVLRSDAVKAKPGLAGNLIVDILPVPQARPNAMPAAQSPNQPPTQPKPQPNRRRQPVGVLPAVPFEIVAE